MDTQFNEQCLKAHNELRLLHKSPLLSLSEKLAVEAQSWAEYIASTEKLVHADIEKTIGENITVSSKEEKGDEITLHWYSEVFEYVFGQEKQTNNKIGHFSQVIWKETREVGFGKCKSEKGKWYYVGRYQKSGNAIGRFLANIEAYGADWHEHPLIILMNSKRIVKTQISEEGDPNHKVISFSKKVFTENGVQKTETTEVYVTSDGMRHTKKSIDEKKL